MDVPAGSVRVNILGDEYSIRSDVDPETTRRIAEYVDRKLIEIRDKSTSSEKLKLAILTCLNIAGELFERTSTIEQQKTTIAELEERLDSFSRKIDQCL